MIKYFVLLFNLIGLLIFNFFTNDVTVTMTVPQEVQAGSEFTVELAIVKGKTTGLGRFQQELQEGLTATDKNGQFSNADFNFKYQKLRLMWLLLPADETITVKYTIQVDPNFKGKIKLGGSFVYLKDNEKMTADVAEQTINVVAGTGIVAANTTPVDSAKTANTSSVSALPPGRNVSCTRQKPAKNETGDALIVTLTVIKDMANNYAKIQEEIPAGFVAEAIETKGAVFTFKDKVAKFLWMNLPPEGNFTISYKLKPEDNNVVLNNVLLKGFFSFLENDKTYSVDINQTGEQIASKNPDVKKDTVKAVVQNIDTKKTDAEKKKEAELKKEQEKKELALKKEEEKKEKQRKKDEAKQKEEERKKELAEQKKQQKNTNSKNTVPDPQKGVVYKVQLAAGHSPINAYYYFKNLKVNDKVSTELHDGWRKYTIGAFPQYQAARDQRVYIWGNTPIGDAFVSAYNNGNRITVQEALMIVNQKWVK